MQMLDTFHRLNRGESLLADAQIVHSLLDIAEATQDADRAREEIRFAREAMHSLNRSLITVALDARLRSTIEAARDRLRARLSALESCNDRCGLPAARVDG